MKDNTRVKVRKKICYYKDGDVVREFENAMSAKEVITGGPDYFVYSTKYHVNPQDRIFYLSHSSKLKVTSGDNCRAKTLKASKHRRIFWLHIVKLIVEILKFRPHHLVFTKRRYLHIFFLVTKMINAKFTISVHSELYEKRKLDNLLIHHALKIADSVICHGPYLKQQAVKIIGNDKNIFEYNASCQDMVNLDSPNIAQEDLINDKQIILFAGRMIVNKGVYDLYEACRPLLFNNADLVLCFAGGGPECNSMRLRCRLDKLEKQIFVFGELNRSQIAHLLRKAWVAVTPSRRVFPEGFCKSTIEAIAMGVPVIGPDCGPFPFIIQNNRNGFLFSPDSINDLQTKLSSILKSDVHDRLKSSTLQSSSSFLKSNLLYGEAFVKAISKDYND